MPRCPYCDYEKPSQSFTDEHPLPRALGGNLRPTNPFQIRVCDSCNAACGRWIDGPFARSWFISNLRARSFERIYTVDRPQAFPLIYIGPVEEWPGQDGTVCDLWLGPTGDVVHHFHKPYQDGDVFAGRPPHVRPGDLDPGRVFLRLVASNPEWHPHVLASVRDAFKTSPIHYLNLGPSPEQIPHPPVPDGGQEQLAWLRSLPRVARHASTVTIDLDFGSRFLVKCGLGLGTALLGHTYATSSHAKTLRAALWEKDRNVRATLKLRGAGFIGGATEELDGVLSFKKCHTVALLPSDRSLALILVLYGSRTAMLEICDDPSIWNPRVPRHGLAWVIFPPVGLHSGQLSFTDYIRACGAEPSTTRDTLNRLVEVGTPLPVRDLPSSA